MRAREFHFLSRGVRCAATHLEGAGDAFLSTRGDRPCVVMAHGFGGTRDTGLRNYFEGFALAGFDVVLFDYRGFGDSEGSPRQLVSYTGQREDYEAAILAARALPNVDPTRIVLWGTSYSGGHVVPVGVEDGGIAAAIAMTPAMDGIAALASLVRRSGPLAIARLTAHGLLDLTRQLLGKSPHLVSLAAAPGELGFLDAPRALEGYTEIAGPTWRNEVCARAALEVALNRPIKFASRVSFPLFVQIGELDATVPASACERATRLAGPYATKRSYPLDHFDVYDGGAWQPKMLADQLEFLRVVLADRTRFAATGSHFAPAYAQEAP